MSSTRRRMELESNKGPKLSEDISGREEEHECLFISMYSFFSDGREPSSIDLNSEVTCRPNHTKSAEGYPNAQFNFNLDTKTLKSLELLCLADHSWNCP